MLVSYNVDEGSPVFIERFINFPYITVINLFIKNSMRDFETVPYLLVEIIRNCIYSKLCNKQLQTIFVVFSFELARSYL